MILGYYIDFIVFFLPVILLVLRKPVFADEIPDAMTNLNGPITAEVFSSWSSHQHYLTSALLVFAAFVTILIAFNALYVMKMNTKISHEMNTLIENHKNEIEEMKRQCNSLIDNIKENEKTILEELSTTSRECKKECTRIIIDAENSIKEMLETTFRDTLARRHFNTLKSNLSEFTLDKNTVFASLTNLLYWRNDEIYDLLEEYLTHYRDDMDIRNLIYKIYKELSSLNH